MNYYGLYYLNLKNRNLLEPKKFVYTKEQIRHIFITEYIKQQRLLNPILQIKLKKLPL